jgi:hypothetical protein
MNALRASRLQLPRPQPDRHGATPRG